MRELVVGDIHSNYRALKQVIKRSNYNYNEDLLIFLGDYVDGYSEAKETLDYLILLEKKSVNKPIFLLGNHDIWALEYLTFGEKPNIWLANGGQTTVNSLSLRELKEKDIQKYMKFFSKLHYYYIDEDNRAFVHAGFDKGLGKDDKDFYIWDRELWDLALEVHSEWKRGIKHKTLDQYKEIFIGHTTTMNWFAKPHWPEYECNGVGRVVTPMNRCNVWNLDTGAGYRGRLTIMDVDTKKYWHSDSAIILYPEEKGR